MILYRQIKRAMQKQKGDVTDGNKENHEEIY